MTATVHRPRPIKVPGDAPEPSSAEDSAQAIFRDADRNLAVKILAKRSTRTG